MVLIQDAAHELSRQECLSLLPTMPVGRVVFTSGALPAVLPVNFVLDGAQIVLRTAPGGSIAMAVPGSVVAFEVDDFDRDAHNGWSVTVIGRARAATDPVECGRLAALALSSYAGPRLHQFIAIPVDLVTGRRVGPGLLPRAR